MTEPDSGAGPLNGLTAKRRPPRLERLDLLAVGCLLLVGLIPRLAFAVSAPVIVTGDSPQYYDPAYALLHGGLFAPAVTRPPLYPLFIALIGGLSVESLTLLTTVQHALGLATAVVTYALGRLLFGRLAGLLAGGLVALSGGAVLYEQAVMSESLFTLLLTLAVLFQVVGLKTGQRRWFVLSGLGLGLCTLTRSWGLFLMALCLPIALVAYRRRPLVFQAAAITLAASVLLLPPRLLQLRLAHGEGTPGGGSGQTMLSAIVRDPGFVFYDPDRSPPDADPRLTAVRKSAQDLAEGYQTTGRHPPIQKTVAWLVEEEGLTEGEVDSVYRAVVLDAIKAYPQGYARIALEKLWANLAGGPEDLREHLRIRERSQGADGGPLDRAVEPLPRAQRDGSPLALAAIHFYQSSRAQPLLLLLALFCTAVCLRDPAGRAGLVLPLVLFGGQGLSALALGGMTRYYYPVEPLLHILAAGGGLTLLAFLRARLWPRVSGSLSPVLQR